MCKPSWLLFLFLLIPSFVFSAVTEKQMVIKKEEKSRAWLGVVVEDLSKKMLDNLNIENGVIITKVNKDSPAAKAELQGDDIILALDGHGVTDTENLIDLVREKKVGDLVEIEYLRAGTRSKVQVKLAQAAMKKVLIHRPQSTQRFNILTEDQTWLGVYTVELTEQLRAYFGVPQEQGILIKEVVKESPAEKGGLKAGDVIIKVAEKKVRDLLDIKRAVNYFEPGDEVEIKVIREKKEKTFKVKLEARKQKENVYFYGGDAGEFEVPLPAELDVDIPEVEIDLHDFESEYVPLLEELPEKLEWEMKGLNEKLRNLNEKMKHLEIKVITNINSEI